MRAVDGLEVYCQAVERIEWDAMQVVVAESVRAAKEAFDEAAGRLPPLPPVRVIFDDPWSG